MNINLGYYFVYNENSPSGLSTINGKNVGYQKTDKNLKYWRTSKFKKQFYIHRIIWILVNGEIPDGMVVNHLDNNGLNNKISNLELCTVEENNRRTLVHTGNGIRKDNTLMITGIKIIKVKGYYYTVSRIRYNKILYEKLFSHLKFTETESIKLAIEWRKNKIREFNELGAGFTEPIELVDS